MTLACPACGQAVRPQARYCSRCGWALAKQLAPGTELANGDYVIVRSISKGGMGAVYLAQDRRAFNRLCVVKQMLDYYDPRDLEERRRAQKRFEEEGRTLASLSHPGIPRIYAFIQEHGRYYIVMEYIRGENLASFVTIETDQGSRPPVRRLHQEEVIRYVIQVCYILEYLHAQPRPVVHQDIKPANLIVEDLTGDVRLVDFGTARYRGHREGDPPTEETTESAYGTMGYAPPEQYRGRPEPRSDVFALAATAYHLLTDDDPAEHPFQWPKLGQLPRELAVALQRALRNDPQDRSTAKELRQALEAMSTPHRTLQAFTFPGNVQIRTVGALPALADEHWDAARSFLYQGDFQRWLRDINRHDLVVVADQIVARERNQDLGLEKFLQAIDPGLPDPRIVADPLEIDVGSVSRVSALTRRITLRNVTRGYTMGNITGDPEWVEVYPQQVHLWAGIPTSVRINIRTEDLPFRRVSEGRIIVRNPDGQPLLEVPVKARVSLGRETARILWRIITAALPQGWRYLRQVWAWNAHTYQRSAHPFIRHPWLFWVTWFLLSAGCGVAMYFYPQQAGAMPLIGPLFQSRYGLPDLLIRAFFAPLAILGAFGLGLSALSLVGAFLWGNLVGAFRSLRT